MDDVADIDLEDGAVGLLQKVLERVSSLERENAQLKKRVENLEEDNREKGDRINELEEQVADLEDAKEAAEDAVATSKEIASAVNALQEDDVGGGGDRDGGRGDQPAEASSPMDFFVNCQQFHVDRKLSANRARAVQIVRRHEEFAQKGRATGARIFEKSDVAQALHVIMGKSPHRETVNRVWEYIDGMGKQDIEQKDIQVGKEDSKKEALKITSDTLERFDEGRYVGMNLLEGINAGEAQNVARGGGVTPVVTRATA
ncbi:hypothetical protein NP511_22565 (plasmid) [Natrinema thermotolerans]|uniref:Uncharacterized protein n=2 Tax=Natrinema thermotolerans TaxID=121872 RepID=A0AAF0T154_9EURY|nr:hypothetical protein [Natrinema thermotolerans]WMT10351.1 hypothetical protein NP511_22565 [Natrinema thermotolerans]